MLKLPQISKKNKCNIKNAVCLNSLKSQCSFLRDVKSVMKRNQQISKMYSFYYTNRKEEHGYKLLFKKNGNNLDIIIGDANGWNDTIKCLTMTFYNPDKSFSKFKKSKIHQINKGACGKEQGKKIMTGGYILNLSNKLNDILNVEFSQLQDDSKIEVNCDKKYKLISLKIVELIKYGKTWYEKEGGYSLDDKNIYDIVNKVQELTLSNLIKYAINPNFKGIAEFRVKDQDIKQLYKLLEKLNVGKNIKMKNLYLKAFGRKSPLKLCEQYIIYDMTVMLPRRKMAETITSEMAETSEEHTNYELLNKVGELHTHFSDSTRIGKKMKTPSCSLPPIK